MPKEKEHILDLKTASPDQILEAPFVIEVLNPNGLDLVNPFEIETLQETQEGDLKEFSGENAIKLKRMLLRRGFDIPFFRFRFPDGKSYLADGYGRRKLFKQQAPLDKKGNPITEFPAVWIDVSTLEEAAERLLEITSSVNIATMAGLTWYAETYGLDMQIVQMNANIVEIDGMGIVEPPKIEKSPPPKLPGNPKTVLGDLYELKSIKSGITHRVQCGDSCEADVVSKTMGEGFAILMATDPPYGVEYDPNWRNEAAEKGQISYAARSVGKVKNDDVIDWTEAWSLFTGEVCYVWHAAWFSSMTQDSLENCGFEIISQIIWAKPKFAISRGDYHWQHEPCWYAHKKGKRHNWQGSRSEATLWQISQSEMDTGHGTQKPLECMSKPIENNTAKGEGVYDPFLGSGTTLIGCEQLNRVCYGQELDEGYMDIIVRRWVKFMQDNNLEFEILRNGEPTTDFNDSTRDQS